MESDRNKHVIHFGLNAMKKQIEALVDASGTFYLTEILVSLSVMKK